MEVVLLVAAAVIAGGVVVVAIGRGGELARFPPDARPLDTDGMTAADVALLRPPPVLWGYDMRATDEALSMVARALADRDVKIATLRRQLADLQSAPAKAQDADPGRGGLGARPAALRGRHPDPERPPAGAGSRSARERPGPAQSTAGEPGGDRPGDGG